MKAKANRTDRMRPAGIEPSPPVKPVAPESFAAWGDEMVIFAANEVAQELPVVEVSMILSAASECRRDVPVTAGTAQLRHCIRQRALGLLFRTTSSLAPDSPAHRRVSGGLR